MVDSTYITIFERPLESSIVERSTVSLCEVLRMNSMRSRAAVFCASSRRHLHQTHAAQRHWMPFTDNVKFKSKPKTLERADGLYYYDCDGREILDGMSGKREAFLLRLSPFRLPVLLQSALRAALGSFCFPLCFTFCSIVLHFYMLHSGLLSVRFYSRFYSHLSACCSPIAGITAAASRCRPLHSAPFCSI